MPVIPATMGSIKQEGPSLGQPGQKVRPHLQKNQSKKGLVEWLVVELLPSKREALSSNPTTPLKE
jgi:hypothetical protein